MNGRVRGRPVVLALFIILATTTSAVASAPRLITGAGTWSLEHLGYGDQVITELRPSRRPYLLGTRVGLRRIVYRLPAGAAQGGKHWYLLRLHYRLKLERDSGAGKLSITAATNGRTAALVHLSARRDGDALSITSSSIGLVAGSIRETTLGQMREDTFENFLQYRGVRPGRNDLVVGISAEDSIRLDEFRIFRDSAIEVTPFGPARISLAAGLGKKGSISVGERFAVRFRIKNVGGRVVPAGGSVQISTESGLRILGARAVAVHRIAPGKAQTGQFLLAARRPGTFRMVVEAGTWAGAGNDELVVRVGTNRQRRPA